MENKKFKQKGFTLVELIVVMAVFGLIMLGALNFMSPVGRMMKNASLQESNAATVDNIKRYFEGTVRYANAVYVHNGDLKYYSGGLHLVDPSLSEEQRQKLAVEDFVNNCYVNRVDSSNEPIKDKTAYVMKIDNGNQGRITESVFKFQAGYEYYDWNPSTSAWDDKKAEGSTVSVVSINKPVINEVYFDKYSIFTSIGYNTMEVVKDGDLSSMPTKKKNDQYFGHIVPVGSYGFSPSMFAFTFTTYKNDEGTYSYHSRIDDKDVFASPYSSSNASLALLNINSAFGGDYRSNLDYCPVRYNGNGYTPSMQVDTDGDGKWDYVNMATTANYFSVYDPNNDAGGDCIYIIYTLPE